MIATNHFLYELIYELREGIEMADKNNANRHYTCMDE